MTNKQCLISSWSEVVTSGLRMFGDFGSLSIVLLDFVAPLRVFSICKAKPYKKYDFEIGIPLLD